MNIIPMAHEVHIKSCILSHSPFKLPLKEFEEFLALPDLFCWRCFSEIVLLFFRPKCNKSNPWTILNFLESSFLTTSLLARVEIKLYKLWSIWVIIFFGHNCHFVQNSLIIFNVILIQNFIPNINQNRRLLKFFYEKYQIVWWKFWFNACDQKLL